MKFIAISLAFSFMILSSCKTNTNVIAATGTTIGVSIKQNPGTNQVEAELGYHRGELAYVPTNKGYPTKTTDKSDGRKIEEDGIPTHGSGAKDTAEVLMEIKYYGIFSIGENSGIYQRLAVGETAVSQPGAAFLMAKGLTDKQAEAAAATFNVKSSIPEKRRFKSSLLLYVNNELSKLKDKKVDPEAETHLAKLNLLDDLGEFDYIRYTISNDKLKQEVRSSNKDKTFYDIISYYIGLETSIKSLSLVIKNSAILNKDGKPFTDAEKVTFFKERSDYKNKQTEIENKYLGKEEVQEAINYFLK